MQLIAILEMSHSKKDPLFKIENAQLKNSTSLFMIKVIYTKMTKFVMKT